MKILILSTNIMFTIITDNYNMYPEFQLDSLLLGLTGGTTIASSISLLNNAPPGLKSMLISASIFAGGWAQIISSFRNNETRDEKYILPLTIASIAVFLSAKTTRLLVDNKRPMTQIFPVLMTFMVSWLVIGKIIGIKKNEEGEETTTNIGFISPLLIFAGMFIVNSIERPRKIVGGMGMPIFQMAWVTLSLVNSMK